jgi:adenosylhomocysteine nucleosidase
MTDISETHSSASHDAGQSGRLTELIDQAFDYRGFVTLSRRDGSKLVGFVYDRGPDHVELFDEAIQNRIRLALSEITDVELTGEDTAAKAARIWERRKDSLESPETSVWGDWEARERPVLILTALPMELRAIAAAIHAKVNGAVARGTLDGVPVIAIAVGMGGGAAQVIAAERPRLVVSCGLAGGLDGSLASGDLVLASSVLDEVGDALVASDPLLRAARLALAPTAPGTSGPKIAEGEIVCTTAVAATPAEKRALARPGRLAIDLESGPIARAAQQAGIPWLALRVVIDPVDSALPAFTREAHRSYVLPALRHALRGPRAVVELGQLASRSRAATHALEQAVRRLAPALAQFVSAGSAPAPAPVHGAHSNGHSNGHAPNGNGETAS